MDLKTALFLAYVGFASSACTGRNVGADSDAGSNDNRTDAAYVDSGADASQDSTVDSGLSCAIPDARPCSYAAPIRLDQSLGDVFGDIGSENLCSLGERTGSTSGGSWTSSGAIHFPDDSATLLYTMNDDDVWGDWLKFRDGDPAFTWEEVYVDPLRSDVDSGRLISLEGQVLRLGAHMWTVARAHYNTDTELLDWVTLYKDPAGFTLSLSDGKKVIPRAVVRGDSYVCEGVEALLVDAGVGYATIVLDGETLPVARNQPERLSRGGWLVLNDIDTSTGDYSVDGVIADHIMDIEGYPEPFPGAGNSHISVDEEAVEDINFRIDSERAGDLVSLNYLQAEVYVDGIGGIEPHIGAGDCLSHQLDEPWSLLGFDICLATGRDGYVVEFKSGL